MNVAFLIGRVLVGVMYIQFGVGHFFQTKSMAQWVASKGLPFPELLVIGSGILLILGGASILLGLYPKIGVLLLIIFLIPVTFIMHNFWADTDPQMKMVNMISFWKNLALVGSALMYLLIPEPWPMSVGKKK